jgi:hypothetical protein
MKKIVLLALVLVAGVAVSRLRGPGSHDDLSELQTRLDAAERSYQSAARAAGLSGIDTTADAASSLAEVERVERELRERSRTASPEAKVRINKLLARVSTIKSKLR